jgi:hypothetical protein
MNKYQHYEFSLNGNFNGERERERARARKTCDAVTSLILCKKSLLLRKQF